MPAGGFFSAVFPHLWDHRLVRPDRPAVLDGDVGPDGPAE
ncbi:hypothetical protein QO011_007559 [Labrys wisconsinensis]|uniref:Uncharacterized protein n=1 Tax=Labrys wisconsinensis TaxID=425677 RepID=A0ABU0JJR4_9HYPH|nr:hypothetical protein [Labrys wisconsinensis]